LETTWPTSYQPYDGKYSGEFLDENRVTNVNPIVMDQDYLTGVGSTDGEIN
jgi:hypothetical protein